MKNLGRYSIKEIYELIEIGTLARFRNDFFICLVLEKEIANYDHMRLKVFCKWSDEPNWCLHDRIAITYSNKELWDIIV